MLIGSKFLMLFRRSRKAKFFFFLFAMGTCAFAAYSISSLMEIRTERMELSRYADRLVRYGDQLGMEATQAIDAVATDHLPPCSDRDLQFMRNLMFASEHLRDIGRLDHNAIACAAAIGRFDHPPLRKTPPDIVLGDQLVWVSAVLITSTTNRGFVLQEHNISVVLNPAIFQAMEEPAPRFAAGYLIDPNKGLMAQTSGPHLPLKLKEITAGRFLERGGIFYQPRCSQRTYVCALTGERRHFVLERGRGGVVAATVGGALLGALLAWIVILIEAKRWSSQSQFRRAVRNRAINVVYQPIFDLDTGRVTGAEALARWSKDDGEVMAPDVFIALAESRGFITELTRVVIDRVIDEVGEMMAAGKLRVTVNITAYDLIDPEFLPMLQRVISSRGIAPGCLGLELTERSTADQAVATEALARLKKAGFTVYIDDFGTGYSSLAYLHRLAVDAIKIDRSFTQTVGTEAVTASVVPQILAMARELDLQVVVEGIETEEQAEYFRQRRGGMQGQGWLYSYPLAAAELRTFVRARRG